jgi:hypothetical protein
MLRGWSIVNKPGGVGKLERGLEDMFSTLILKRDIFINFTILNLFFQNESVVSPYFSEPLLLKCIDIKKKRESKWKGLNCPRTLSPSEAHLNHSHRHFGWEKVESEALSDAAACSTFCSWAASGRARGRGYGGHVGGSRAQVGAQRHQVILPHATVDHVTVARGAR